MPIGDTAIGVSGAKWRAISNGYNMARAPVVPAICIVDAKAKSDDISVGQHRKDYGHRVHRHKSLLCPNISAPASGTAAWDVIDGTSYCARSVPRLHSPMP